MAASGIAQAQAQFKSIISDIGKGIFSPVYLLMGEDSFYSSKIADELLRSVIPEELRDFNQSIVYGPDTDAFSVASLARSFPMMAERRLVLVRDAQSLKDLESLATYIAEPMDSTVLALFFRGGGADKRRALYKNAVKSGVVFEFPQIRDYQLPQWIESYYRSINLSIGPEAASVLAEFCGASLEKIESETDKIRKNLPDGVREVGIEDVKNVVSRGKKYTVFELAKELSYRRGPKALRMAAEIGGEYHFALPMATAALFSHFYRILKYVSYTRTHQGASPSEKAAAIGVNPYFIKEYEAAAANYPLRKLAVIISLLEIYDAKGKGVEAGESSAEELFTELVSKILFV